MGSKEAKWKFQLYKEMFNIGVCVLRFVYLKGRVTERRTELEGDLPSTGSLLKQPQQQSGGESEARSQGLHSAFPCGPGTWPVSAMVPSRAHYQI